MKAVEAARERLAAKHARKIRGALAATVNVERLVRDWESSHPVEGVTPEQARAWVKIHTIPADKELASALRFAYADAWALGALSAAQLVSRLKKKTKAASPELSPINWDNWTPGERAAAALLNPPNGLQSLLASRMTVIKDINNTTYDRLGTQLSTAMAQGLTNDQTAALLDGVMNDPARSLMIARTETARASSVAARNLYETSGVEYVEWLIAEGCDDCKENADASPIPIDATFPSGDAEPPAHPNCMCALAPYVVDTQNTGGGAALDDSFTPTDDGGDNTDSSEAAIPDYGVTGSYNNIPLNDLVHLAVTGLEYQKEIQFGDGVLNGIYAAKGFDALPKVVDKETFDSLKKDKEVVYRGLKDFGDHGTAQELIDNFKTGDYYAGYGIYGNGTYASNLLETALDYAGQKTENVVAMLLDTSRYIDSNEMMRLAHTVFKDLKAQREIIEKRVTAALKKDKVPFDKALEIIQETLRPVDEAMSVFNDSGRLAAALGYDGITRNLGNETYQIILNRGKVTVLK